MSDGSCKKCGLSFKKRRKSQAFCSQSCSGFARTDLKPNKTSFKKGQKSWNAGTSLSGMKGKHHSSETKEKMRAGKLGDKAPNWKGGITEENYRIRRSGKYSAWRNEVFKRDGYVCQMCNAKSIKGHRVILEADHIKPFASFPELRFDVDNGRTLCQPCHRKTPTWGQKATRESDGVEFDAMPAEKVAA